MKTLHHNGNLQKQKRRCSNIPGRLHQSPAVQLAQELKSVPVDMAVGLHHNGDKFKLYLESRVLHQLIRRLQRLCYYYDYYDFVYYCASMCVGKYNGTL